MIVADARQEDGRRAPARARRRFAPHVSGEVYRNCSTACMFYERFASPSPRSGFKFATLHMSQRKPVKPRGGTIMTTLRNRAAALAACFLLTAAPAFAADETEAGPQGRLAAVLAGDEFGDGAMTDALGYPSPETVLRAADHLGLSDDQRASITRIRDAMLEDSRALAPDYVRAETELETLFATGRAGKAKVRALVFEIGELRKQLRFIHLDARLKMRLELTRDQLAVYRKLRGGQS